MQILAEMQREIEWNLKMLKRNGIYLGGNSFEKMYSYSKKIVSEHLKVTIYFRHFW